MFVRETASSPAPCCWLWTTTVLNAELEAAAAELAWRQASMEETIRGWERDNELYAEGSLSAVELDLSNIARLQAVAEYQRSVAKHAASRSRLNRSRIMAPEAGIVLERNANPTERVNLAVYAGPAIVFAPIQAGGAGRRCRRGSGALPAQGQSVELVFAGRTIAGNIRSVLPGASAGSLLVTADTEDPLPPPGTSVELRY